MNVMHERCAGLDVHKETVVACRRGMEGARVVARQGFCDHDTGTAGAGGLGAGGGLHARGDGVHRGLLEAGVART